MESLPLKTYYFTYKYRDERGIEHIAQVSGLLSRVEASKAKKDQRAFNSRDKRARKTYYDFSKTIEVVHGTVNINKK